MSFVLRHVSCKEPCSSYPLHVLNLNVNSVMSNLEQVHYLILELQPHIVALTATWLSDRISDNLLHFKGYKLFRNDRGLFNLDSFNDTRGGGGDFVPGA